MTFSSFTSSKDLEFGNAHIDVASSDKRLVGLTTNTYKNSGITYINIKLFKKIESQDEYHLQQGIGLIVKEFQEMVVIVEDIRMGPPNSECNVVEKKSTRGLLQAIWRLLISRSKKLLMKRKEKL